MEDVPSVRAVRVRAARRRLPAGSAVSCQVPASSRSGWLRTAPLSARDVRMVPSSASRRSSGPFPASTRAGMRTPSALRSTPSFPSIRTQRRLVFGSGGSVSRRASR